MRSFGQWFTVEIGPKRVYGLDILRFGAIISVMIHHGNYVLPDPIAEVVERILINGVSVFFVLSGFLIGGILMKVLERDGARWPVLLDFWKRRWLRTVPPYLIILTLLAFSAQIAGTHELGTIWPYYLFVQNFGVQHPTFFPEAWTMPCEEWFYLMAPLLAFALVGRGLTVRQAILAVALVAIVFSIWYRYDRFINWEGIVTRRDWDLSFRKQVLPRFDSLMIGVLGAYVARYHHAAWVRFKRPLLVIGMVALVLLDQLDHHFESTRIGFFSCVPSFTIASLALLAVMPFLSEYRTGSGPVYRAITRFSIVSFSVYLIHLSVVQFKLVNRITPAMLNALALDPSAEWVVWMNYVLYWVLSITLAFPMYRWIEMPFMNIRKKLPQVARQRSTPSVEA